jgi:short-subunit dehydrogenase
MALASFSDALRLGLGAWDIPVVVIEPGGTDTAIFGKVRTRTRLRVAIDIAGSRRTVVLVGATSASIAPPQVSSPTPAVI